MLSHFINLETYTTREDDALWYLPGSRAGLPSPAIPRELALEPGYSAVLPSDIFHRGGCSGAHRRGDEDPQPRYVGFCTTQNRPWDYQDNQALPGNVIPTWLTDVDDPDAAMSAPLGPTQVLWAEPPPLPSCGFAGNGAQQPCGSTLNLSACVTCAPGRAPIMMCEVHLGELCARCHPPDPPSGGPPPAAVTVPLEVPTAITAYMPFPNSKAYVLVREGSPRTRDDASGEGPACHMSLITHHNDLPMPTKEDWLICAPSGTMVFVRDRASMCVSLSTKPHDFQPRLAVWYLYPEVMDISVAMNNGWCRPFPPCLPPPPLRSPALTQFSPAPPLSPGFPKTGPTCVT